MEVMQSKDRIAIKGSCEYSPQDKYTVILSDKSLIIHVKDGDKCEESVVRINKRNARMLAKIIQEFYETEE